jgi:putative membrane-bound dehydrogenase-like protein
MQVFMAEMNFIALTIYTVYLCGILGGAWLFWRSAGRKRIWGLIFLIESAAAAFFLTIMSSRYWSTGAGEVIDLGVRPLISTVASVLLPLSLGVAVVIGTAHIAIRLRRGRYGILGSLLPIVLIPAIFSISVVELTSLTERSKPIVPEQVVEPEPVIQIVDGFTITAFKDKPAQNPTSIVFGPDNNLYIANFNGEIWAISMVDGKSWLFASGFQEPKGLAWHGQSLYVASNGKISVLRDENGDNVADETKDIITGMPSKIYHWHANNGIVFGNDGRMYFAVGSTTDSSPETARYAASVLSAEPDGSDLRTYAVGVRNPYRLAFNSEGDLFGTENGPNDLKVTPSDELNHIMEGADYGFPRYFGFPPPNSGTVPPVALFPPHASADGIVFYQGNQFPTAYHDNAFVTLLHRGEIYRVQLTKDANGDYSSRLSLFVSGLNAPLDIATGPDGNLYVIDFNTSTIYRIAYESGN